MNKLVKIDNKLYVSDNKLAKFVPPVYHVNLMPTEHGSYSASPTSGYTGTDVTLYNTPDQGYVFDGFRIEGSELWSPSSFDLYKSDVNVHGYFKLATELMYLSYMTQLSGQNDVPMVNKIGGVWNFNSNRTGTSNVMISGAMPNTYSGQKYASFGGAGVTGILPVTTLRKFTICGWMRSNTSGAGEFWGVRYHTAFNFIWFYFADATKYLDFNFGLADSNYTIYEGTNLRCPTSIATKGDWAYVCLYIDRDENRCEYWVNNHHMFDISGKADLFNGNQNFDTILRFYPDANYSGFYLCELAIWSGPRKTDVPTEPLSNVYGG